MHRRRVLVLGAMVLAGVACRTTAAPAAPRVADAERERQDILARLVCAIVLKGWQPADAAAPRGHNIGAVLVNPEGRIVAWGRNCNLITKDPTQHAEVRALRDFLSREKAGTLKDYEVHTTLEPCAMCAAMMSMASVKRAYYLQSDPAFGRAAERLGLDSTALPGGYPPYPRVVDSRPSAAPLQAVVDERFAKEHDPKKPITDWLRSESARGLFEEAADRLRRETPRHEANVRLHQEALKLLEQVPAEYVPFRNN